MNRVKKTLKCCICVLLIAIGVFWGVSIIRCEYLTAKYGFQFGDLYSEHTSLSHDYLKILDYSDNKAVVYYVERGEGGDVLCFERETGESDWHFVCWRTIWSRTGSASEFVWPYIR